VGKTRLALEYLYRFAHLRFPDGVFWIDANAGESIIEERFHGALRGLNPRVSDLATLRASRWHITDELVKALDEPDTGESILFVIDGLPEIDSGELPEPLATLYPMLERLSVLVTTRSDKATRPMGIEQPLSLVSLMPEPAVEILTRDLAELGNDRDSWFNLAEWMGFYPQAMETMNRSLKASVIDRDRALSLPAASDTPRDLDAAGESLRGLVPENDAESVARTILACLESLPDAARKAGRLLSHLAPAPIPTALTRQLDVPFADPETLTALVEAGFLEPLAGNPVEYLGKMHPVVAAVVRATDREAPAVLDAVCDALLALLRPDACRKPRSWPLLNACAPHVARLLSELSSRKQAEETAVSAIQAGLRAGLLFRAQQSYRDALAMDESVLEFATEQLGPEHPQTLSGMGNLALSLQAVGELERARELQRREIDIRRKLHGEPAVKNLASLGALSSMNNLALTMKAMGELDAARELQQTVFDIRRGILGEEHPATVTAVNNLVSTLQAVGELDRARSLQERVLEIRRKTLGAEHPSTLESMDALASTLQSRGENEAARALQEKVLETRVRVLGEYHPATLASMNEFAVAQAVAGELDRSRDLQEKVLRIRTEMLGREHPSTLAAFHSLAPILHAQGDLEAERRIRQEELDIRKKTEGEGAPTTLASMSNLASTLFAKGDLEEARKLQEEELELCRKNLGEEHPGTIASMNNLASTLHATGATEQAVVLQRKVLDVHVKVIGHDHPDTLTVKNNYATMLKASGEIEGARKLQEEVYETRARVLGKEHPDTLASMNSLASTLKSRGDLDRARTLQEQVTEIRKKAYGIEHPETLTALNNLASILKAQGELKKALSLQERVHDTRKRVLGDEHPDTLTAANNLASMLKAQGNPERARKLEEGVLEIRKRVLGLEHPGTTISAWNLVATLLQVSGRQAALPTIRSDLSWLLERKPETLATQQRQIRKMVRRVLAEEPANR
jgi:tetratricopeptide (TPR) repeat protein